MKHRLVRLTVVLGIIGTTMGVTAGVAASQPASQVDLPRAVCEALGGTYISDFPGSFFCYLPDGSIVICSDGVCITHPPVRALPSRATVVRTPLAPITLAP